MKTSIAKILQFKINDFSGTFFGRRKNYQI